MINWLIDLFKKDKSNIFLENLKKDWGKEDVFGPLTKIDQNSKELKFYKSYYLISKGGITPDIKPIESEELCKHDWYETFNFYTKCKKCNFTK